MRIPGWQAQFSEYRSAIYYLGHLLPLSTGFGVGQRPTRPCRWPEQRCGQDCVNTYYDPLNCGGCGPEHECFFRDTCCNGRCERNNTQHCGFECYPCAPGEGCCRTGIRYSRGTSFYFDYECTQLGTKANCSGCDDTCPSNQTCQNGSCACPPTNPTQCGFNCYPSGYVCCGLTGLEGACPPGEVCCNLPDGTHCIPEGGDCCGFSHYCEPGEKCCGNGCIPSGECCAPDGTGYQCTAWQDCCPGTPSGCMPKGYKCCGDHPCPPNSECCGAYCKHKDDPVLGPYTCCHKEDHPGEGLLTECPPNRPFCAPRGHCCTDSTMTVCS